MAGTMTLTFGELVRSTFTEAAGSGSDIARSAAAGTRMVGDPPVDRRGRGRLTWGVKGLRVRCSNSDVECRASDTGRPVIVSRARLRDPTEAGAP